MGEEDRVCKECYDEGKKKSKEDKNIIKQEQNEESNTQLQELKQRSPEYKKYWNKNGIIQYKDDHIAILHRCMDGQIEFIIALSDCTKEGYRLMVIDDVRTTDGIISYYYLQKKEDIL